VIDVLLDTHALIWLANKERWLGRRARRRVEAAATKSTLGVSAISFWEASLLHRRARVTLPLPIERWRVEVLRSGIVEAPLDGAMAVEADILSEFHADPADRFIVATAIQLGARLITADERVLAWPGPVNRVDARR
jgi:PIN domain nuclease of toxin-antitoxin system